MIHTTIAAGAFVDRDVVFMNGYRYYDLRPEALDRQRPRGKFNGYELAADGSHYKMIKYDGTIWELDLTMEVFGDGDIWFTAPKRFGPPNLLAANDIIRETKFSTFASRWATNNFIVDWHLITHAHGHAGGTRGSIERGAKLLEVKTDAFPEFGIPEQHGWALTTTNRKILTRYTEEGKLDYDQGPLMEWGFQDDTIVFMAGRNLIFTTEELALDASTHGLAGKMASELSAAKQREEGRNSVDTLLDLVRKSRPDITAAELFKMRTDLEKTLGLDGSADPMAEVV